MTGRKRQVSTAVRGASLPFGTDKQYIYNLSTKGLPAGTWLLRVTADLLPGFDAQVLVSWK